MPSPENISTKLQKIAKVAKEAPELVITSLSHHIDVAFLVEAYRRTRKEGATGIDGRTAKEYAENLEENLQDLLNRFKSGRYQAPAVRRVNIPKGDGRSRPIGIPTFEDKVLQRAVVMVMDEVYEQTFADCSYGFRRGRSAHKALQALWDGIMDMGGGWVIELDIESYFDAINHEQLREFVSQRVSDGVVKRTINKWLKAGVLEDGEIKRQSSGTPQGGVISPLLANIYLHYVLDEWFAEDVQPCMRGKAFIVRYADDAVIAFEEESDARGVLEVLPKRFARYGLRLHPEKTRLVRFRPPSKGGPRKGHASFTMLGFTHYWGLSRKQRPIVKRKTAPKSLSRALASIGQWCRDHRHQPVQRQQEVLRRKVRGHYAYFGITGNSRALKNFVRQVERRWQFWLARRGGRRTMPWDRFSRVLKRYPLPPPRIVHSVYRRPANL